MTDAEKIAHLEAALAAAQAELAATRVERNDWMLFAKRLERGKAAFARRESA